MDSKKETNSQFSLPVSVPDCEQRAVRWAVAKQFLIIFLPSLALVGGIMTALYYTEEKSERTILETHDVYDTYLHNKTIASDIKTVVTDLTILSGLHEIERLLEDKITVKKAEVMINLAGRQRMLTQKMSKELLLIAQNTNVEENKVELKKTADLFERTLKGLINGDAELKLPATTNEDILAQLNKVQSLWKEFKLSIHEAVLAGKASKDVVKKVLRLNIPLLKEMDKAVKMYEVVAENEGARKMEIRNPSLTSLSFSKKTGLYDQICFLDKTGMEVVRVNYNDGSPYVVPEDQLQFKGNRYYFKETIGLERGEIYVSPFGLSIEGGEIEQPLKPMIRFGTPVFDTQGRKWGVVVLNYLGGKLFQDFDKMHLVTQSYAMLLNSNGFWLKSLNPRDEWGFMYEDRKNRTFEYAFPEAWKRISNEESGQFYNEDGLFTFGTVYPLLEALNSSAGTAEAFEPISPEAKAYYWKVVVHAPSDVLETSAFKLLSKYSIVFAILILILAFVSLYTARAKINHKMGVERQAQLLKELERSNQELKDFAYIVSHDLKAPLRAISSLGNWISTDYADKFDEDGKEQMNLLLGRAKRMNSLIDGILQYSRVGRAKETRVDVDLNELVTEVVDMIAPPKNIEINIQNNLPAIVCEKTRIEQVFQNLISNAVKYMDKPKGEIKISCVENKRNWKFSVADNGPGIGEKYFEKIFIIFQTLSPRDEVESTGVGLTVVKKIIETYGGKIWVESKVGHGSTFFFTLPRNLK
ncbi:MAG: ATP-binding protein [Candidatus Brocadiales bacterium]